MSIINVVDSPMGSFKSTTAIDYMNSHPSQRYVFATQYNDECQRIQSGCPELNFRMASADGHSKSYDAVGLIKAGENIAISHSLLGLFSAETIKAIKDAHYILILDEAFETMKLLPESRSDQRLLESHGVLQTDEITGVVSWHEDDYNADGKFSETRKMIERGGVVRAEDGYMQWRYPRSVFETFDRIFILTYMFDMSPLYYYLVIENLPFSYVGVKRLPDGRRTFCPVNEADAVHMDVRRKIHLLDNAERNRVGDKYYDLSVSWYRRDIARKGKPMIAAVRNSTRNVFRTDWGDPPKEDIMWSSFKDPRPFLEREQVPRSEKKNAAKGRIRISGQFVEMNCRAKNQYGHIHHLAYLCNVFMPNEIKLILASKGITVTGEMEDRYAVSVMVQWIWRSAIRNGDEIWLYLPSSRMRALLMKWIDQVDHRTTA